MKNAFGLKIYEMKEVLEDSKVESAIVEMLKSVLKYLGLSERNSEKIITETLECARNASSITEYEKNVHKVLDREGLTKAFPEKLFERTKIMCNQLKPYLLQDSVLDLGCGDGKVGELLSKEYAVNFADVFKHPHIDKTGLKFTFFKQGEKVPIEDNKYDNTLTLYVFHHSDNPIDTLREAIRVTKPRGRIIVMESVYGVDDSGLSSKDLENAKTFLNLSKEQQRMCNIFFDHFWNRVLMYSDDPKNKINVPYNFNTPDGWKKIFEENGVKQIKLEVLGIDQPTVPEFHTLHVLEKL